MRPRRCRSECSRPALTGRPRSGRRRARGSRATTSAMAVRSRTASEVRDGRVLRHQPHRGFEHGARLLWHDRDLALCAGRPTRRGGAGAYLADRADEASTATRRPDPTAPGGERRPMASRSSSPGCPTSPGGSDGHHLGRATRVAPGTRSARSSAGSPYHVDSPPEAVTPGRADDLDVAIIPTAYELAPGHCCSCA